MIVVRPRLATTPTSALVTIAVGGVVAFALGLFVLPGGPVEPLLDAFGAPEIIGWSVLALLTGGIAFGGHHQRPSLIASGLVGSAALLGATPYEAAVIAMVGAVGSLWRFRGMAVTRLGTAAVLGFAAPGLLALAASFGGPMLGVGHPLPVASLLALWFALAVLVPLADSMGTMVGLPPSEHVDPGHMLARRFEPQSVLTALAILAVMTYAAIGVAAVLVVLLPAAAARVGFRLHDEGRRSVSQTLAAMTILPEWVGIVDVGHTGRVRDVVERAALQLDIESQVRDDLVRAAELHELGHLDGGVVDRDDRGRIARSGAAVLEQARMRERVVRILQATDPDRPMAGPDPGIELGATLIAAACDLDRQGPITAVDEAVRRVLSSLDDEQRAEAPNF